MSVLLQLSTKMKLKVVILLFTLILFCVSTVQSSGCSKGKCWAYCKDVFAGRGSTSSTTIPAEEAEGLKKWCWTRTSGIPLGQVKECQNDGDCGWKWYECVDDCTISLGK